MPRFELLEDRCLPSTTIAEFPLTTPSASPGGITTGPDGNIWFTETQANQIGTINPVTHAIAEYSIPKASSSPLGIASGPDGNLWFTEADANQIGMINPATHAVTEFAIPTASSQPTGIVTGQDGNVWFTEADGNQIGMINPSTHVITEFPLPTSNSSPLMIAAAADGNLWFTENNSSKIGWINPVTHIIADKATPSAGSQPYGVAAGPDGNIWFTENSTNRVVQVNAITHGILEYPIPTKKSGPTAITAGPDGSLWFFENNANKIGSIDPKTGIVTETAIPTTTSGPGWITSMPSGMIWFTEANASQIGEVVAAPSVTTAPISQTITAGQTATFTAAAGVGLPPPAVQWMVSANSGVNFTPLTNGGIYSGVATGTLTITGATTAMTGYQYEAVFTNAVSPPVATTPATLTVTSALSLVPALPQGVIGTNYNQTISVVGSTSAFTLFSANNFSSGGTGLTYTDISTNVVNGTITINGTPTAAGTATFSVAIANSAGNSLTQNLSIVINGPLAIVTASLPQATAGATYNQLISVSGGAMPYTTFSVSGFDGGTTGMIASQITALAATGTFQVNGVPLGAGTVTFNVNVTDSAGTIMTKTYTIVVNPPLVITPTLPQGTAGTAYHQVLTVTGGGVPYTAISVSAFNPGATGLTSGSITTDPVAGTITVDGTPLAAGAITFTANVLDSIGATLSKAFTIKINAPLSITSTVPIATAGMLYHPIITVASGAKPYATLTVTGFTAGSTGLTAAAFVVDLTAGTVTVNGTPTGAGIAAFTVNATDAIGNNLAKTYNVTIDPAPTIGALSATQWTAGKAGFTGQLTLGGGTGTYAIKSATGLPTGLTATLKASTISFTGTPSAIGTFASSITIQDSIGASVTRTFSITINSAPTFGNLSATQWTVGRSGFNGNIGVSGGTGGLSIASTSGLPAGLAIVLNGKTLNFTGSPLTAGTFTASVTLRDSLGAATTKTFNITINATPTLSDLTMAQWTVSKSGFTGVLKIAAGTGPFTITGVSGLPTGLTAVVVGGAVQFTGTPSAVGKFSSCTITLRDAAGASVSKSFAITINPPVVITTTSLAPASMAAVYSTPLTTTGGTGTITYKVTAGSLPPGMIISSKGIITGATRGFGTFTFTITGTDVAGATFRKQFTLSISGWQAIR